MRYMAPPSAHVKHMQLHTKYYVSITLTRDIHALHAYNHKTMCCTVYNVRWLGALVHAHGGVANSSHKFLYSQVAATMII